MKLIKIITLFIIILLMADYFLGKIDVISQCNNVEKIELNNNILKKEFFTQENNEKYTYYKESFLGIHKCSIYINNNKIIKKQIESNFYLL